MCFPAAISTLHNFYFEDECSHFLVWISFYSFTAAERVVGGGADKFASSIETMSNHSILLVVFSVVASLTGLYGFMIGTLAIGFIATANLKQLLDWGIFPLG